MARTSTARRTGNISLRVAPETLGLIDQAAQVAGKTRTGFMIDAVRKAAEEALLDQAFVGVDRSTYEHFISVLDQPPSSEGLERLTSVSKPWES
jgi:uncharacterized protein (DUF1778 family)